MDRELVQRWKAGWEAAQAVHTEELRRATPEERYRQLEGIFQFSARHCRSLLTQDRDDAVALVRQRWNKLKSRHKHVTS